MLEHIYEYIQKKSDYLQRCKKKTVNRFEEAPCDCKMIYLISFKLMAAGS